MFHHLKIFVIAALLSMTLSACTPDLPGIGDEVFDASSAIKTIRKGNKLMRIIYTCPCNTDAVKPLAQKLADGL